MPKLISKAGAVSYHKLAYYSSKFSVVRNTVMFIKKNNNPRVAGFLAEQLRATLDADSELLMLDKSDTLITFVPRGKKGRVRFGFDQSELIALELGKLMGLEVRRCVCRVKEGKEQKKLGATERLKNVRTLYAPVCGLESVVSGKRIILVDDIVTTGASMAACISYLVRARAREVICLSVALTDDNK
jgi:competence protein ComFC